MSIPGVGVQTSAAFAAAVDEAGRFKRSRTAGAYFGLVPRRHQSGELDWTGRITKQGTTPSASLARRRTRSGADLGGDLAVLQAPMFDGLSLDPFAPFDDAAALPK
jgi:hypothetical protein